MQLDANVSVRDKSEDKSILDVGNVEYKLCLSETCKDFNYFDHEDSVNDRIPMSSEK